MLWQNRKQAHRPIAIHSHTQKQKNSTCASKRKANVGQKKREVGAPEEKEAKRQRTGEAEEGALRLYFKRQEEELKGQELKESGCGVPARKCRRSLSICAWPAFLCRAVGCIDGRCSLLEMLVAANVAVLTCGWVLPEIRTAFRGR
jgi:hypothetical protein